jgi:hypothetical protein
MIKSIKYWTLLTVLIAVHQLSGQTVESGKLYLTISSPAALQKFTSAVSSDKLNTNTGDATLSKVMAKYGSKKLEKATPIRTGNKKLDNWYVLTFEGDAPTLMKELKSVADKDITDIELVPRMVSLAASNDYFEPGSSPLIENRALNLINAGEAWGIRSSNTVKIAVSGEAGYKAHEDLAANIHYNENPFVNTSTAFHGTAAAGFAGGVTHNNLGIASAGYNAKVLLYTSALDWNLTALTDAITRGAKVVTMSYGGLTYSSYHQGIIDYGYSNGVVFVAGAGNGRNWELQFGTGSCDKTNISDGLGTIGNSECMIYPASLNHVISVTSVAHFSPYGVPVYLNEPGAGLVGYYNWNWKDLHEEIANDVTTTFSHNPKVDICAPGYFSPCLFWDDATKYRNCYGTSFAGPMVASAVSLIMSINPCFTPDDVEYVIKTSAFNSYSLTENQKYAGLLGAGRLDLRAAATLAQTYKAKIVQNVGLTTSTQQGHTILMGSNVTTSQPYGNVTISSGQSITFNARQMIEIQKGFEASSGSQFFLNVNPNFNLCP